MKSNSRYPEVLLAIAAYKQSIGEPFDIAVEHEKRLEKERALNRKFRGLLAYPLTVLAIGIILFIGLLHFSKISLHH